MNHALASERHDRDFCWVAVCACGHESEGPNPETARKRHGIHEQIQVARAALRGEENDGG